MTDQPDMTAEEAQIGVSLIEEFDEVSFVTLTVWSGKIIATGHTRLVHNNFDSGHCSSLRNALVILTEKILTDRTVIEVHTIRRMALKIITEKHDHGICTENALRVDGFTQRQIDIGGQAACDLAAEMAGSGPFEITTISSRNAA